MYIFVAVLLLGCAISGLLDFLLAFFVRVPPEKQKPNHAKRISTRIRRGLWSFWICLTGFVALTSGFSGLIEVVITISILLAVGLYVSRIDLSHFRH